MRPKVSKKWLKVSNGDQKKYLHLLDSPLAPALPRPASSKAFGDGHWHPAQTEVAAG